jgi:hypothetical protein
MRSLIPYWPEAAAWWFVGLERERVKALVAMWSDWVMPGLLPGELFRW